MVIEEGVPFSLYFQPGSSVGWNNIGLGEGLRQASLNCVQHLQDINNPFPHCCAFVDAFLGYETGV